LPLGRIDRDIALMIGKKSSNADSEAFETRKIDETVYLRLNGECIEDQHCKIAFKDDRWPIIA